MGLNRSLRENVRGRSGASTRTRPLRPMEPLSYHTQKFRSAFPSGCGEVIVVYSKYSMIFQNKTKTYADKR